MSYDFTASVTTVIDFLMYLINAFVNNSVALIKTILLGTFQVCAELLLTTSQIFKDVVIRSLPFDSILLRPFAIVGIYLFILPASLISAIYLFFRVTVRPFYDELSDFNVDIPTKPPEVTANTNERYGKHYYLSLKSIRLHYVMKLPADNEINYKYLIVFLHGFNGFWYSWRHQIDFFANLSDYGIVSVDLRGCGESEKPDGTAYYRLEYLVKDVKELLDTLNPNKKKKVILVGHSIGGFITHEFVLQYPSYLYKYVTICTPPPYGLNITSKQIVQLWPVYFALIPYLPEFYFQSDYLKYFDRLYQFDGEETIKAYKYAYGKSGAFTYPLNFYRANFTQMIKYLINSGGGNKTRKIRVPGLAIHGDKDRLIDRWIYKTEYRIPDLIVKELNGEHYPHEMPSSMYTVNLSIWLFVHLQRSNSIVESLILNYNRKNSTL